ncbi:MAG TPA: DUF4114 domain-containing protein [Polyangiales bacterium]|nr:DUF4114 domain-containing protein [Polyangiales bacterium]
MAVNDTRWWVAASVLLAASGGARSARALDLTLVQGGRVSVELLSSDAVFHNTLSVVSPATAVASTGCRLEPADGLTGTRLMSEKNSQHGCRVELDSDPATAGVQGFAAGTVLRFGLCAQEDTDAACENVWSSDPSSNSDGYDHVRTTPLFTADFPDRIFQIGWEDLANGGDEDFNDLIAVVRVEVDTDGDGLWDDWELHGADTDGDGTIDLDLPGAGADPNHKDIFVEVDWMDCATAGGDCAAGDTHDHKPKAAAVTAAVNAFAAAPVPNPDGTTGINLHLDLSNAIAHQNVLNINGLCFAGGAGIGSFDTVKADPANFGPNNPRRFAYHYSLWSHQQLANDTTSGCAELPGNDVQVSLGGWNVGAVTDFDGDGVSDRDVGTIPQQVGTLLHELGHNLNFQHGGSDSVNFKPNFVSAMNYLFQMAGVPPADPDGAGPLIGRVDYSRGQLATLVETSLSEPPGVGLGTDNSFYTCPNRAQQTVVGNSAADWNCNGVSTDMNVSVDINNDRGCVDVGLNGTLETAPTGDDIVQGGQIVDGPDRTCNTAATGDDAPLRVVGNLQTPNLVGSNDWANLRYTLQSTGSFDDGYHDESLRAREMKYIEHQEIVLPDLEITGAVVPMSVVTGMQLSYQLTLKNLQPHAAKNVTLAQQLPASLQVVSCTADHDGVCAAVSGGQSVSFATLPGGESASIEIRVSVACGTSNGAALTSTIEVATESEELKLDNNELTLEAAAVNPPPTLSSVSASPNSLMPPNHKLVPVTLGYTVTDNCGTPVCNLTVSSNEPVEGTGDGDTAPDWVIQDNRHVSLRAERSGSGNGRIYSLLVSCSDSGGGVSTASTSVTVPRN